MSGEAKSSPSVLTISIAAIVGILFGGLAGWYFSPNAKKLILPGDSPILVRGGSITAVSAMGWTGPTGAASVSGATGPTGYPPYTTYTYGSLSSVILSQLTLLGATGFTGPLPTAWTGATALTQNWRVDVLDRNQNSPDSIGIRVCSAPDCSLGALASTGATGPLYLMPIGATGAFFVALGPQDTSGSTEQGMRFLDRDTVPGATGASGFKYCGNIPTGVVDDPDWCQRIHLIKVVIGPTGVTGPLLYNCPDGACKIEFGVYPAP